MNNNSIFNPSYSQSNPFTLPATTTAPAINSELIDSYARLEAIRQRQAELNAMSQKAAIPDVQATARKTVFSDIADEFNGLSEDETAFITNSPEYQKLNNKYQAEFSNFLISKFSNEYMQSGNTRTLEELLYEVRRQKDRYKEKFAEDINQIRDQNKQLTDQNNALALSNQELQEQLKEIRAKLWSDEGAK
jgi:molybdopterin converting factor small subunit